MSAAAPGARERVALLAAYAVVTVFCFPQPLLGRVVDLGVALAWLSPALLLLALRGLAPGRAARFAGGASLVAHAVVLHWLYVVTVVYGRAPAAAGVFAPVGVGLYVAAFTALFAAGFAWLARLGCATPLAAAVAWTSLDHLRSFALSGFPWATLGYAQHQNAALLPLVAYTGVYGLSFVTVLGGAGLAEAASALRAGRRPPRAAWLALAGVVAAHGLGLWLRVPAPDAGRGTLRVAVLQGNVDQGVKWSEAFAESILATYEELAREAARRGAAVIVWPESSVPGFVDEDPALRRRLAALATETDAVHVLGVVGLEFDPRTRRPIFYDSARTLAPGGSFGRRYDKSHLVPFGEYVPLRDVIGLFVEAIARGMATDNVTAGPGPGVLPLPVPGARAPLTAAVPICYELIFPDVVRRMVGDGAEILFAITNDAWYGRTGAPYQFLAITAVRSAENRVWTARAANTGVSAIIDARGRVRERTRIFERGLLVADVPLRPAPLGGSFYARHGDVFALACWFGSAAFGIAALRRRGRERRP